MHLKSPTATASERRRILTATMVPYHFALCTVPNSPSPTCPHAHYSESLPKYLRAMKAECQGACHSMAALKGWRPITQRDVSTAASEACDCILRVHGNPVATHLLHKLEVLGVNLPLWLQRFIVLGTDPDIPAQQHQLMSMSSTMSMSSVWQHRQRLQQGMPDATDPSAAQARWRHFCSHLPWNRHSCGTRRAESAHPARCDLFRSTRRFSAVLKILAPWVMRSCATSPWSPRTASCSGKGYVRVAMTGNPVTHQPRLVITSVHA